MKLNQTEGHWHRDLAKSISSIDKLIQEDVAACEKLERSELEKIKSHLDIRVPATFLDEIKKNNTALAKQFIPTRSELIFFPEELEDPIGDHIFSPVPGLTHRYPDRVLFKPTYTCASYCRFCFRRTQVSHQKSNAETYRAAFHYISEHSEIWEVILSGGDPLVLPDPILEQIMTELAKIPHIKIIRLHTRIPSVLPTRITPQLIALLKGSGKSIWVAVHINCAEEFTPACTQALSTLAENGIPVVLQSVLLKDINDSEDALISLLKTAVENRVKPYYLHYPDLARGTEHFRIPLKKAIALVKGLRGKISGLSIPQLIIDLPEGKGKIPVNAHKMVEVSENFWELESPIDGSLIQIRYPQEPRKEQK